MGIATFKAANWVLDGSLPRDNRRCAVPPAQAAYPPRSRPGGPGAGPHPVLQDNRGLSLRLEGRDLPAPSQADGGSSVAPAGLP